MSTSGPRADPRAIDASVVDDELSITLPDGRHVLVSLTWFARLLHASPERRANWRLVGDGEGIHWPDVDEDLSVARLLRGAPPPDASGAV